MLRKTVVKSVFILLAALLALSACSGSKSGSKAQPAAPAATEAKVPALPVPTEAASLSGDKLPANGKIGDTWTSPKDGMVMVAVPAGEFLMGSREFDKAAQQNEYPMHTVNLDSYWIDKTEVTNAMFAKFLTEKGTQATVAKWYEPNSNSANLFVEGPKWVVKEGFENLPVIEVTWFGAQAYCNWAGRRLPTEAEWEKAARGTDGRIYPWGNSEPTCGVANFFQVDQNQACAGKGTVALSPAGTYSGGASIFGAFDMAGNVWEWVADYYKDNFYNSTPTSNPTGPEGGSTKVYRGGSFESGYRLLRTAQRKSDSPDASRYFLGFRCAATP